MARHNAPLVALIHQHINQRLRKSHFRRKKALGVVAQIAIAAPRLPPCLLENLKFLAKDLLGQQRRKRVVIGEAHEVQTPRLTRRRIAVVPSAAISKIPAAAQLPHVVYQRAGIAQGKAAARKGVQRFLRPALIRIAPVIQAENIRQVVFGMLAWTDAAIILAILQHDGIPRILHTAVLAAVGVPLRPVDGLVVMPEAADMHIAVGKNIQRHQRKANPHCHAPNCPGKQTPSCPHATPPFPCHPNIRTSRKPGGNHIANVG